MRSVDVTVFGLLGVGCLLRLVYLDADPAYYQWIGYITDEGRWSEHARAISQYGTLTDQGPLHIVLAPLYQVVSFIGFEIFGVSFASARLPSALSGIALLFVLWSLCRRIVAPPATAVALSFVVFHADFVMLSRIAIPEMAAMTASLIAFALILSDRPHRRRLLGSGLWVGLAIALKATALPVLPIFAVIAFADAPAGARFSDRLSHGAWLLAPVAMVGAIASAVFLPAIWEHRDWLAQLQIIQHFVGMLNLFESAEVLLRGVITAPLCMAAIGVWIAGIGFAAVRPAADDTRRRMAKAAAIWVSLFLPLTIAMEYFPDRYIVHIFTPLVLITAVGVDLMLREGWGGLGNALSREGRERGWVTVAWIALPSAILLAPIVAALAPALGFELRVRFLLMGIAISWIGVSLLFGHWRDRDGALRFAIAFPIIGTLIWSACWALWDTPFGFWPEEGSGGSAFRAGWRAALAAALAIPLSLRARNPRKATFAASAALAVIWMLHLSPAYFDRHYTLIEISRDLGKRFGTTRLIEMNAEGLFLENAVRYRWVPDGWPEVRSEYFVNALRYWTDPELFRSLYEPIVHYDVFVFPRFAALQPNYWLRECLTLDGHTVSVYRLREPLRLTE